MADAADSLRRVLPDEPVDGLPEQVGVADVPGVLVVQVHHDRRRLGDSPSSDVVNFAGWSRPPSASAAAIAARERATARRHRPYSSAGESSAAVRHDQVGSFQSATSSGGPGGSPVKSMVYRSSTRARCLSMPPSVIVDGGRRRSRAAASNPPHFQANWARERSSANISISTSPAVIDGSVTVVSRTVSSVMRSRLEVVADVLLPELRRDPGASRRSRSSAAGGSAGASRTSCPAAS